MLHEAVGYLLFTLLGVPQDGMLGAALHFFVYDTVKIFFLLTLIIFAVTLIRSYFKLEKVRAYLTKKGELAGNVLAALFGIVTPFCSCSAIPMFLGFLQARIPLGVTFSFLISSPLNNEVAIAMLFSLFGWKVAALYIGFGLAVAIVGGFVIGRMRLGNLVLIKVQPIEVEGVAPDERIAMRVRLGESWEYTTGILRKIWPYILFGVGIGAFIHGFVPTDFIVRYAGGNEWYAVPLAVLLGVPMYSNAAGVMPLIEVLTSKGMAMGTALAFMMAVTALSLPEAIILKRILHIRLIALFFGIVAVGIICVGYIFNAIL